MDATERGPGVLQIHPTRACNLRCLHCYSLSGPDEREALDARILGSAIEDAAREGYGVLSVSGGEPLAYADLQALLDRAHDCGMATTITTNGMLLDARRLQALRGRADLVAVSIDGRPASHNRIRGSSGAFETMESRLEGLRLSEIPFGFVFTLTESNVAEIAWAAEFAAANGAALFQIHPLEASGRAVASLAGERPDRRTATVAWAVGCVLRRKYHGRMAIQVDLLDIGQPEPGSCEAVVDSGEAGNARLAGSISPLVVESDGTVSPLQHGMPRRFALGNIKEESLGVLASRWRSRDRGALAAHCRSTLTALRADADLPFVSWFEEVARSGRGNDPDGSGTSPRAETGLGKVRSQELPRLRVAKV